MFLGENGEGKKRERERKFEKEIRREIFKGLFVNAATGIVDAVHPRNAGVSRMLVEHVSDFPIVLGKDSTTQ